MTPTPSREQSFQRAIAALRDGRLCKVICGIGSRKARRIRNLAGLYAAAGVHVIDMAAHIDVLEAVLAGLEWARLYHALRVAGAHDGYRRPLLMVSLGLRGDPHVGIPLLDRSVCAACELCYCVAHRDCAARPLEQRNDECPQCMECVRSCPFDAISVVAPGVGNDALVSELVRRGVDAVELHVSGATIPEVEALWRSLAGCLGEDALVSFSVGSSVSGPEQVGEQVRWVAGLGRPNVLYQAEGHPMSGAAGAADRGDASFALVRELRSHAALNGAWVQASGGCDLSAGRRALDLGLSLSGVGFGSFARQLVGDVLDEHDLAPDSEAAQAAVARARTLVRSVGSAPEGA